MVDEIHLTLKFENKVNKCGKTNLSQHELTDTELERRPKIS